MAKRRYKEIKQDDKFHETLTALWRKAEPYLVHVGIAAAVVLVVATLWTFLSQQSASAEDRAAAEHFKLLQALDDAEPGEVEAALEKLAAFAKEHQGRPEAALALIELAQRRFLRAGGQRLREPEAAKTSFQAAANAAEQFLADFPGHRLREIALLEAGKARIELGQYDKALEHFLGASQSPVLHLAALAQWHAAFCHERLGNLEQAREAYTAAGENQGAGWIAQQAEFNLARLDREAADKER